MVMISEFVVLEGSLLEGTRLEEVIDEYNVKILHFHSPKIDSETGNHYNPKQIIGKYFLLKVIGSDEAVKKLRLDSVKYKPN